MKNRLLRRICSTSLVAILTMSSMVMPVFAEDLDFVSEDQVIDVNDGTINYSMGTIEQNNGLVINNSGNVGENDGNKIEQHAEYGSETQGETAYGTDADDKHRTGLAGKHKKQHIKHHIPYRAGKRKMHPGVK